MTKQSAIHVQELTVRFGKETIFDRVSFAVEPGEIVAIIGPNGSGKTTLLKTLLGLIEPERGDIRLLGEPLSRVRQRVGYVPQRFAFDRNFPITVREFLELVRLHDAPRSRIKEKLEEVGLSAPLLEQPLGELSGGELQRVLIARAVINNPDILFLDEPSAGVDIVGERHFYSVIKHLNQKHGTTVLLVSHEVDVVARFVTQVICLNRALICHGSPKQTLTEATLKKLFGDEFGVYEHQQPHRHL